MKNSTPFHRQFSLDFSGHTKARIQRRMDRIVRAMQIWYELPSHAALNDLDVDAYFEKQGLLEERYLSLVRRSELTFIRLCAFD